MPVTQQPPTTTRLAETLYTMDDVAGMLRMKPGAVRNWQVRGYGPERVKIGREVRYRLDAVITWVLEKEESGNRNYQMRDVLAWLEADRVKEADSE